MSIFPFPQRRNTPNLMAQNPQPQIRRRFDQFPLPSPPKPPHSPSPPPHPPNSPLSPSQNPIYITISRQRLLSSSSTPLAALAFVPRDVALFSAGAFAGAAAKTFTAPLDRIKLLMQTHGVRVGQDSAKKAIGFFQAIAVIGKEEGIRGYWKGNLPQVIRVIPYSAVQLFAYETYKKLFRRQNGELSVVARLSAGAFAGMTATFITYPLDVLRLRLAVEPGYRTMSEVAFCMLRDEGFASFLQRPWAFSYCHSSLYCSEFLCF
ncbi:unnamed protein product [Vicia faba]|uniref:Uncharacterized protein n=1 Tax=Vicia faba TaxID=3906 RepID=A0AAV1AR99_VICFA|nr:unnamed protein product [Vicia faba]